MNQGKDKTTAKYK